MAAAARGTACVGTGKIGAMAEALSRSMAAGPAGRLLRPQALGPGGDAHAGQGLQIAVVGGGIAGLATAWWLGKRHRVTLYERHARPGFSAHSVAVAHRGGDVRVDVPLRVFYPGYYPTLAALYDELGVASEPVSYASGFMGADRHVYFRWRNLRVGGWSLPLPWPGDLVGVRARSIALAAWRFHRQAPGERASGAAVGLSIAEWLVLRRYPPDFVDGLLLPVVATVCTCPLRAAREFPAEVVIDYLCAGVATQSVRRAVQGADDVAARLSAGIGDLRCGRGVRTVRRVAAAVEVTDDSGATALYDHVVMAAQANHARALLADAAPSEDAMLEGFDYRPVEVVMHRDAGLMPRRPRDWSAVNAWVEPGAAHPMSTIWVNAVQPALRDAEPLFQTVHPLREPGNVVSHARFERPVVGARSEAALAALQRLHAEPGRRLWWCGSYAQPGIPLLESAVRSAVDVVHRIEAQRAGAVAGTAASAATTV